MLSKVRKCVLDAISAAFSTISAVISTIAILERSRLNNAPAVMPSTALTYRPITRRTSMIVTAEVVGSVNDSKNDFANSDSGSRTYRLARALLSK